MSEILDDKPDALVQKLDSLPTEPGVYKFLDRDESVLYVGKAKNLRTRVRTYFQQSRQRDGRIRTGNRRIDCSTASDFNAAQHQLHHVCQFWVVTFLMAHKPGKKIRVIAGN